MKAGHGFVAVLAALTLWLPAAGAADSPLDAYRQLGAFSTDDEQVKAWDAALRDAVGTRKLTPQEAAAELGPRFQLPAPLLLRFEDLWFRIRMVDAADGIAEDERIARRKPLLQPFAALIRQTHYAPLVLRAAAAAFSEYSHCDLREFHALTDGAPDLQAMWNAEQRSYCAAWLAAIAPRAPHAALAEYYLYVEPPREERLALSTMLMGPIAGVAPGDAGAMRLFFIAHHLEDLFDAGLLDEALATFDALPAAMRQSLLDEPIAARTVTVDGLPLRLRGIRGGWPEYGSSALNLRLALAAAHYARDGDTAKARSFLTAQMLASAGGWFACPSPGTTPMTLDMRLNGRCPHSGGPAMAFFVLALDRPGEDPYDFLEKTFGDVNRELGGLPNTGVWAEAFCKWAIGYAPWCALMRAQAYRLAPPRPVSPTIRAILGHRLDGAIAARREALEALSLAAGLKPPPPVVDYQPPPFKELALPAALRTARPDDNDDKPLPLPADVAPLPQGFTLVRFDRTGAQAVAISKSWNLDTTGDVFGRSFWVHLSHDGGKSWDKPLYTGLIDSYPYVVAPTSKLPIRDGDTLRVEVRIEQVSSLGPGIEFVVRQATGLYLRLPLAVLQKDSDGDGLTDLLERHLLLDPHNPDSDGDGIPDGDDMMPNVAQAPADTSPRAQVLALVLNRILHPPPTLRPDDSQPDPRTGPLSKPDAPVLIQADPAMFAALRLPYLVLIYDQAGARKMNAISPDFIRLGLTLTFNRAGDRAFATYGLYAGAGTIGLKHDATGWHLRVMSGWVT